MEEAIYVFSPLIKVTCVGGGGRAAIKLSTSALLKTATPLFINVGALCAACYSTMRYVLYQRPSVVFNAFYVMGFMY